MAAFSIHHRSSLLYTCSQSSTDMPVLNPIICWTNLPSGSLSPLASTCLVFWSLIRLLLARQRSHWVHGGGLPLEGSRAPERACLSEWVVQPERVLLTGTVEEMQRGQPAQNKTSIIGGKRKPKHWLFLKHTCSHTCFRCVFITNEQKCNINK